MKEIAEASLLSALVAGWTVLLCLPLSLVAATASLSTLSDDVHRENSWRYALWPSLDRPAFSRGTSAVIDYAYDRGTTTLTVS